MKKWSMALILLLILSATSKMAFALGDAGLSLQDWYNQRLFQAKEDISKNTVEPLMDQIRDDLGTKKGQLIQNAVEKIKKSEKDVIEKVSSSIFIHKDRYIDQIKAKQAELEKRISGDLNSASNQRTLNSVPSDFDIIVNQEKAKSTAAVEAEIASLLTEMNKELDITLQDMKSSLNSAAENTQKEPADTVSNIN
jgi:hypothetical protein